MSNPEEGHYIENSEFLNGVKLSPQAKETKQLREYKHLEFVVKQEGKYCHHDIAAIIALGPAPFFELLIDMQLIGLHKQSKDIQSHYDEHGCLEVDLIIDRRRVVVDVDMI